MDLYHTSSEGHSLSRKAQPLGLDPSIGRGRKENFFPAPSPIVGCKAAVKQEESCERPRDETKVTRFLRQGERVESGIFPFQHPTPDIDSSMR